MFSNKRAVDMGGQRVAFYGQGSEHQMPVALPIFSSKVLICL